MQVNYRIFVRQLIQMLKIQNENIVFTILQYLSGNFYLSWTNYRCFLYHRCRLPREAKQNLVFGLKTFYKLLGMKIYTQQIICDFMMRKNDTNRELNKGTEKWESGVVCLNPEVGKATVWFRNDDKNSFCQREGLNWGIMKKAGEAGPKLCRTKKRCWKFPGECLAW